MYDDVHVFQCMACMCTHVWHTRVHLFVKTIHFYIYSTYYIHYMSLCTVHTHMS